MEAKKEEAILKIAIAAITYAHAVNHEESKRAKLRLFEIVGDYENKYGVLNV